ncbi:hypothetical protein FRB94_004226 [Tulasnella sp. JGI-2019a]|nr:hypothetical protein FRB94_004226 [Tulasnella sp. JGI-2019a]
MDSKTLVVPTHTTQPTTVPLSALNRLRDVVNTAIQQRRIVFLALVVNFGALLFGYDSGIAGATIVLPSFQRTFGIRGSAKQVANTSSNIVSILYLGALIGGLVASRTSYQLGRRRSLLIGCIFFIVGGIVQTTSTNVGQIYAGRALAGVGTGTVSQVSPIFVSECASKRHRSVAVAMFQLCLVIGGMLAYWTGYAVSIHVDPTTSRQWRIPIGLQLLPTGLFTIGLLFLPESPRYLAFQQIADERRRRSQGLTALTRFPVDQYTRDSIKDSEASPTPTPARESEAAVSYLANNGTSPHSTFAGEAVRDDYPKPRANHLISVFTNWLVRGRKHQQHDPLAPLCALAYLRNVPLTSPYLKTEMAEIYAQLDEIEEDKNQGRTTWKALLANRSVRKRFAVAGFIGTWQIWTAQNAILYYAPTIFMSIGFSSSSTSLLASGVFTCLKVLSTTVALAFTINRFGRVQGLTIGGILQGIIFFIIGIILATYPLDPTQDDPAPANFAMMAMIYVYVLVYSFTLGPLPWVYSSELFPPHIRDAGQLLFVALTWINNYAVAKLTPIGFADIG